MADIDTLADRLKKIIPNLENNLSSQLGEITITVSAADIISVCQSLRDSEELQFDTLIDICGVDYSTYGQDEWSTQTASSTGFSRAVGQEDGPESPSDAFPSRFAVVYHLLSVSKNHRLRIRVFALDDDWPRVPSVISVWTSANWYEREAFDLLGIMFDGHTDLRRLMTDYGFIGHPFRKDFPLSGKVEMRYDPDTKRVIYQPVTITPRVLVPRVIRDDHRYSADDVPSDQKDSESNA